MPVQQNYLFDKAKMSLWQAGWLTNKPEPGTADLDRSSSFCAEMAFKPKMAKKTKKADLWGFDILQSFTDMSTKIMYCCQWLLRLKWTTQF